MLDKNVKVINEKTLVPISVLSVIVTALVLGVIHVQTISSRAEAASTQATENATEIKSLKQQDIEIKKDFNNTLNDLNSRLARMEGAIGMKIQKNNP